MKFLDIVKSTGFTVMLTIFALGLLMATIAGYVKFPGEFLQVILGIAVVMIVYTLTRLFPKVDEIVFFLPKKEK